MTIQLLTQYGPYSPHVPVTLSSAEETRLVGLGLARYYTSTTDDHSPVAVTYDPDTGAQMAGPYSVSGAGNAAILSIASPGGTAVGSVLSAQLSPGWTVTGYQWTRDGVDIAGATSSTYTLVSADAGKAIGVRGSGANYTSSITTAAPAFPPGQMYLDSLPLFIDGANLAYA